jgi:hypothetical protein
MPWQYAPMSEALVLHARFRTADGRQFGASAEIRVTPNPQDVSRSRNRIPAESTVRAPNAITSLSSEPEFIVNHPLAVEISPKPTPTLFLSGSDQAAKKPPLREVPEPPMAQVNEFFPIPRSEDPIPTPVENQNGSSPPRKESSIELPPVPPAPVEESAREGIWKVDKSANESVPAITLETADGFPPIQATNAESPPEPETEASPADLEDIPMRYQRTNRPVPSRGPMGSTEQQPKW